MTDKTQENRAAELAAQFEDATPLVLPTLSLKGLKENDALYVEFTSPMKTENQTDDKGETKLDPDTKKPLTITTANVVNLIDGTEATLVIPFIMEKGLTTFEKDNNTSIVANKFKLVKGRKVNRTNLWGVWAMKPKNGKGA